VLSALNHFPQDFGLDQSTQAKQTDTAPQTA